MQNSPTLFDTLLVGPATPLRLLLGALDQLGWTTRHLHRQIDEVTLAGFAGCHFDIRGAGGPFAYAAVTAGKSGARVEAEVIARLEQSDTVTVGIVTDGTAAGTRFLQRLLSANRVGGLARLDPWAPAAQDLPLLRVRGADGNTLRPIDARFEYTLFEAHSHMRDVDGLHAPEAMDELCKLLFLKVYDERTTVDGSPVRLQRAAFGSLDDYAAGARRLLAEAGASRVSEGGNASSGLERLWTPFILSNAALVRCLDEIGPYSIEATAMDVKGRAFQNVLRPAARAGMGQYFTPENVGRMMVTALAPAQHERVLDPFAGSAHFLAQVARFVTDEQGGAPPDYCRERLFGIEKSERMLRVAWTDLMLHNLQGLRLACGDSLGTTSHFPSHALDSFDVVITNPPFGSVLRADAIVQLGKYETAVDRASTPVELLAFERAARFLRPGGRLAIVVPDGTLSNQRAATARRALAGLLSVRAIVSLPVETFAPFGANVKTSVVFARRTMPGERLDPAREVFLGQVDAVGYDASGKDCGVDEIPELTRKLVEFFSSRGW